MPYSQIYPTSAFFDAKAYKAGTVITPSSGSSANQTQAYLDYLGTSPAGTAPPSLGFLRPTPYLLFWTAAGVSIGSSTISYADNPAKRVALWQSIACKPTSGANNVQTGAFVLYNPEVAINSAPIAFTGVGIPASFNAYAVVITGLNPAEGEIGTALSVGGYNLKQSASGNPAKISFFNPSGNAGIESSPPAFVPSGAPNDGTILQATVPPGAATGRVSATADSITYYGPSFRVDVPLPPVIVALSVSSGPIGSTVVITGSGFSSTSAVTLNGTVASFVINSDTQITVTIPPGATSGPIQITNAGGSVNAGTFTVVQKPADFTGDGKSDILWRYQGTGSKQGYNQVWQMNGTSYVTAINLNTTTDLNWQIVGTGDFTGDGKTDILWRYQGTGSKQGYVQIWQMNGTSYVTAINLDPVTDLNWQIVGTGDFTGDGKTDILWRYQGTGSKQGYNQVWQMNGTSYVSSINLNTTTDLNWQIVGTDDFTGDGKTDILWRYQGTGSKQGLNQVWQMNGTSYVTAINLDPVTDLNWQIVGTGDFTGDGKTDILWRYQGTGSKQGYNQVWQMNGTSYVTAINLNTTTDLNWRIRGPR
ncbi:FG-GAP-like repeat-containing protein [Gloeobacter kilaueensis]